MKAVCCFGFVLVGVMNVLAGGDFTDAVVVPDQIRTQVCVLAIEATSHDEVGIIFTVTCDAKQYAKDIRYSNNTGAHLQFRRGPLIVLHCALRPADVTGDKAHFWFRVPKDSLAGAYFTYALWDSSGISNLRYVFKLQDFWDHAGGDAKVPQIDSWMRGVPKENHPPSQAIESDKP